jgi:hypothetical protein
MNHTNLVKVKCPDPVKINLLLGAANFESGGQGFESLPAHQFRDIPYESHGNHTTKSTYGRLSWNVSGWVGPGAADYEC